MNSTLMFQREVESKLSRYIKIKLDEYQKMNEQKYMLLIVDYIRQLKLIRDNQDYKDIDLDGNMKFNELLLTCIAEPKTQYNLNDYMPSLDINEGIYSPRVDIAISPAIKRTRYQKVSLGNYKLSYNVKIYEYLHKIKFVQELESEIRRVSLSNFEDFHLVPPFYFPNDGEENEDYINKRPLHLFGIELENQSNLKHLMGDFLNVLSLAKIPIVIVPSSKLGNCMKMLIYTSTMDNMKKVPIYKLLGRVNVLTYTQFVDILNNIISNDINDTINNFGLL